MSQALGRNKKEAEQRAAFQALAMISEQAPELGVRPPALPAVLYNLSSGPSRPTRSTSSTPESYPEHTSDACDTARSTMAAGSPPGTPASSVYRAAAAATATPPPLPPSPPSVLHRPASGQSSRPSEAEVDVMDSAQLRRQLKAALQREAQMRGLLGRLRAAIDGALG